MVSLLKLTNSIIALSLLLFVFLIIKKRRKIFHLLSKIPLSIWILNSALLFWRLYFIPHDFSSRGGFGSWLLWWAKSPAWEELFIDRQAPVYLWSVKFFSNIFKGVGFEFVIGLNIVIFFLAIFSVYLLVLKLSDSKTTAYFATIFFAFSPVFFIFSLTEDYTIMALFFGVVSLLFATLYLRTKEISYLLIGMAASILAAGARPEYIFIPFFFLLFCLLFFKNKEKSLYAYLALFLGATTPKAIVTFNVFIKSSLRDYLMHGQTYEQSSTLFAHFIKVLKGHYKLFIDNLAFNLERVTDPTTFAGVFLVLALIALIALFFKQKEKKKKKIILYFSLFFLFLFLFYAYLHNEGFRNFKYLSTTLLPLTILASFGMDKIYKKSRVSSMMILGSMLIFFTISIGIPLTFNNFYHFTKPVQSPHLKHRITSLRSREYSEYKKLSYDNHIFRIFNPNKEPLISNDEDTYFICNGYLGIPGNPYHTRTFIASMPFEAKVRGFREMEELNSFYNSLPKGATIYVIQASNKSVPTAKFDNFQEIGREKFKAAVLKLFQLEQKLISYREKGSPVYLYKMKK